MKWVVAQFCECRKKVCGSAKIRAFSAQTIGGDIHTTAVCWGKKDQIRTIALRASKAQIICLRLVGSRPLLPSSALDIFRCLTLKEAGKKETLSLLDFSHNSPLWIEFLQADRWKNMQPGSSQQACVGDQVRAPPHNKPVCPKQVGRIQKRQRCLKRLLVGVFPFL